MDRRNFDERCTRRLEWWRPHACTTLDGRHHRRTWWPCHNASPPTPTAGRRLLHRRRSRPSRVAAAARQSVTHQGRPWPGAVVGEVNRCGLTTPRSYPNDADHRAGPRAGSGVVRIDPLRFLAGCRTRRLNQV